MPITPIPVRGVAPVIGLGVTLQLQSTFIGPLPSDTFWRVAVTDTGDPEGNNPFIAMRFAGSSNPQQVIFNPGPGDIQVNGIPSHADGDQVLVIPTLEDSAGNALDSGSFELPWTTTRGLGQQNLLQLSSGGGGLTSQQAQQLQESHESTFPSISLDALTLINLTPGGPTGDFVGAQLTAPVFGVIVRIASVPSNLSPQTPDGDYWVPTLAVVRIFRGSDLWQRVPIHTSSHIVGILNPFVVAGLTAVTGSLWLLNLSLQVTFLPGVTGTVELM